MTKTNYEQAQAILNDSALHNNRLYKEHLLDKAGALATLALADAVRGEKATNPSEPEFVYALKVKRPEGEWELVSIYTDRSVANGKADEAMRNGPHGYRYIAIPYRLDHDYEVP